MPEPDQMKQQQPGERYRNYLLRVIADAHAEKLGLPKMEPTCGDVAKGTKEEEATLDKMARNLHGAALRKAGMTPDQIIADWNHRSPEDTW